MNLKGADGNANVTRYIFPEHDFSADREMNVSINLSQEEINKSAWLAYMVNENGWKFQVPGPAYGSTYKFYHSDVNGTFVIGRSEGTGELYDPIEIVRIESNETMDNRKQKENSIIPNDLDTS